MPTFGIEEEVFVTEPDRPTICSLYYLAKLLARNPRYYYTHSAHNFARGQDIKQGLMSGVEISTGVHTNVDSLVDDLAARRGDLAAVTSGLIVPIGHLISYEARTNTCALHIHIGGVEDKRRVYNNIIHFLPALALYTMNSPYVKGEYFGQSYRVANSWAIGPIKEDWQVRFQDVIHSKRLGTLELRVFDPVWDLERVRYLLKAIDAIVNIEVSLPPARERYNRLRQEVARRGMTPEVAGLVDELSEFCDVPRELLERTASDEVREHCERDGLLATYAALDSGYRSGKVRSKSASRRGLGWLLGPIGFAAYFVPRLPYYIWKGIVENR